MYAWSPLVRLYTQLKMWILPLHQSAEGLPKRGLILDMGCGYGYVSNYLNIDSPDRTIIANDPAQDRIAVAKRTLGDRRNLEFLAIDSREITRSDFDGILVVDVLHHVPYNDQQSLIDDVYKKVKPGGCVFLRETDIRYGFRYAVFNCLLEYILYIGKVNARFRHRDEWAKMFERSGFSIERVTFSPLWFPYTHVYFTLRKSANA